MATKPRVSPEARSAMIARGHRLGSRMKEEGKGIFGMSAEARQKVASRVGLLSKEEGTGIFGLSPEAKAEVCRKGGITTGKKFKRLGLGIMGLTTEQRQEIGRRTKQGQANVASGHMTRLNESPQHIEDCSLGGRVGSHNRWHVIEGKKPKKPCEFCNPQKQSR